LAPSCCGRPSQIPHEEFNYHEILFYTLSTIAQANAESNQLDCLELISLLGILVSGKLKDYRLEEINEIHFYKRIQQENKE
jgi:hypothetical protein